MNSINENENTTPTTTTDRVIGGWTNRTYEITKADRLRGDKSLTIWTKKGVNVDEVENFKDFLDNEGFRYCMLESNEKDDLDADFSHNEWDKCMESSYITILENGKYSLYDIESFKEVYYKPLWRIETEVRYILPTNNTKLYNRVYTQLLDYVNKNSDRVYSLSTSNDYGQVLSVKLYKKRTSNYGCPYPVA